MSKRTNTKSNAPRRSGGVECPVSTSAVRSFLEQECPKLRLMVVGDLMLDHWVWGSVSRISPEAPVPIVDVQRHSYTPGGAANVVENLRQLGAQVHLVGIVGNDDSGRRLRTNLARGRTVVDGLLRDSHRPTTLKTRIVAHSQQVVRADFESREPVDREQLDKLLEYVRSNLPRCQCLVLSDYDKGLFQPSFAAELIAVATSLQKPVVVGPKPSNIKRFSGANLMTLNAKEAQQAAGVSTADHLGAAKAAAILHRQFEVAHLVITRGENGMSLFPRPLSPDEPISHYHMPALATQVFDVSGAGDTVLTLLSLALAAGLTAPQAIYVASHAAAVVVKKLGTATATATEILDSIADLAMPLTHYA